MTSPAAILIIGASRGIGLEFVKQAAAKYPTSTTIYATARDASKATDLQRLAASNKHIQVLTADANDSPSLVAVAKKIETASPSLDSVIYNAGVLRGLGPILSVGIDSFRENIDTNVYGAYFTAQVFVPLLLKSKWPKKNLVFLSSTFASMALADQVFKEHAAGFNTPGFDPTAQYNISKSTLNRLGKEIDQYTRQQGLPVLLVHPGLVLTDMNANGTISSEESVSGMLKVIDAYSSPESKAMFVGYDGQELPW